MSKKLIKKSKPDADGTKATTKVSKQKEAKKEVAVKKTVKAIAKAVKPAKPLKVKGEKLKVKKSKSEKEVEAGMKVFNDATPSVKETPVAPVTDFAADLKKSESVAATTIVKSEFTRTRRTPNDEPATSQDDMAEVNRLIDLAARKINRPNLLEAEQVKSYILKCNPDADVVIERPMKGIKSQSKWHITVGTATGTLPPTGYLSTCG